MTRLLVIEDDEAIARPLAQALVREQFDVVWVGSGKKGLDLVDREPFDIVVLDLGLPDIDGLDVCRQIRVDHASLPVVMLTARASEVDIVVGFDAGADDYITKPFRMAELVARLRARVRQAPSAPDCVLTAGELRLDVDARRAWAGDDEVLLTPTEFSILGTLMTSLGRAVPRGELLDAVGGNGASSRVLDMHMSSLRRKLGRDPAGVRYIVTVRGVGYRLDQGRPD